MVVVTVIIMQQLSLTEHVLYARHKHFMCTETSQQSCEAGVIIHVLRVKKARLREVE